MQDQKQQNHNQQKKIALINDFTGFGRCSIAVQLPVISMMKVQCCAVPTAIFSDHTAYDSFYCTDYTAEMEPYIEEWKKLGLKFQGICTGFLGSEEQIRIVGEFIHTFKEKDTTVVVDPVMGDGGKRYATYTEEMCRKMSEVVQYFRSDFLCGDDCKIFPDSAGSASGVDVVLYRCGTGDPCLLLCYSRCAVSPVCVTAYDSEQGDRFLCLLSAVYACAGFCTEVL